MLALPSLYPDKNRALQDSPELRQRDFKLTMQVKDSLNLHTLS